MTNKVDNDFKPKVVLGVAAHPDDLDFGASGSMSKWAASGASVYYLILTDGSKGSDDPNITSEQLIKIRREEQINASKVIGAKDVFFLSYPDAYLEVTMDLKRDIVRHIRRLKPDTVITMDPTMVYDLNRGFINHPDHRAAGQATIDAVYPLSRDRLTFPELISENLEPHKVENLLLVNFSNSALVVDISKYIDQKLAALKEHYSQITNPEITLNMVRDWAKLNGEKHGVDFAESFIRLKMMP